MGLCKCPKKKVTQQFCFNHKVNVCEFCMVNQHPKCVVQSYLQWLEDGSFDPICTLCKKDLANDDCVRLYCYHVFHLTCLNSYANSLPVNNSPSGYVCPDCLKSIFPAKNVNSPVSNLLRKVLSTTKWARGGLGLPAIDRTDDLVKEQNVTAPVTVTNHQRVVPQVIHQNNTPSTSSFPVSVNNVANYITSNNESTITYTTSSRKIHNSSGDYRPSDAFQSLLDIDDDKYRTKSPTEFVSRWCRSRANLSPRTQFGSMVYRRWILLSILFLICLLTLLHFVIKYGRETADRDPMLDPMYNPNIRIEEDS